MATTLATLSKEWRVGLIYGLLGAFAAVGLSFKAIHDRGFEKGLTAYHQACYNSSLVLVEHNNQLVACHQVLDKPYTFMYNK